MADENGIKSLARELTATKERAAAWVLRILITLVGAAGTTVLWLGWSALIDVKTELKEQTKAAWSQIQTLNTIQNTTSANVGVLTQTVTDHLRQESDIDAQLKDITRDHEQRIRTLEHSH